MTDTPAFTGPEPRPRRGDRVSSNIWFALAGLRTGGDRLASCARRMGFGRPLAFDLPTAASQVSGHGAGPGGFADDVELANAAYGQAKTSSRRSRWRSWQRRSANGGTLMRPHLVTATHGAWGNAIDRAERAWPGHQPGRRRGDRGGDAGRGREPFGRQFTPGPKVPGVPTAGKTGTAELGGSGAPHSWFIGFAPSTIRGLRLR